MVTRMDKNRSISQIREIKIVKKLGHRKIRVSLSIFIS